MPRWEGWSSGIGWLTVLSVGAILAINLAGMGSIALVRRGALEESERMLGLETAARARGLESTLAHARADLAFLTGSPVFVGLESALASRNPTQARFRRLEAEGALLLFLRGHPEVAHLRARGAGGESLVVAGRRGGVPVLWRVASDSPAEGPPSREVDAPERPLTAHFTLREGNRIVPGAVTVEATLDPAKLLSLTHGPNDTDRACTLEDNQGHLLARQLPAGVHEPAPGPTPPAADRLAAAAPLVAEGWSEDSPWRLGCSQPRAAVLARLEPAAGRYRITLLLNAGVMTLALLLGMLAIHQARRRVRLEATATEATRVRELERQLFHAERLSTVGRLAAGIAHEINNPLEGMANYLVLARADLERGDLEAARRRLGGVQEGLRRAEEIVRRVLAHADPAATPRTIIDLAECLRQSLGFVRDRPDFAALRFDSDLPAEPLTVRGSATMLGQVFVNLLLNACEAQPGGGEVRLAARRNGDRILVEIADRGPGIPAADAEKIFEPFFSTKNSTGLGLSICYAIARQHQAELTVENRPGGGTVFAMKFKPAESEDA